MNQRIRAFRGQNERLKSDMSGYFRVFQVYFLFKNDHDKGCHNMLNFTLNS
jgi:hypothetical protein